MKHLYKFFLNIIGLLIVLLSACAPAQFTPVQTNTISTAIVPKPTNTAKPTTQPINTPTSTATSVPAATIELACPRLDSNMQFELPVDSKDFETAILNYLNQGGDPEKLKTVISAEKLPPFDIAYADIDADSFPEIVTGTLGLFEKPATIRIFHCKQNVYSLAKSFMPQNMGGSRIELITKLFPAEPPYVIIRASRMAGWGQDFLAVGWHNSEWQIINLATGMTFSEIAFFDQNADGIKEVLIQTKTAATPGGGISRIIIDTYSWNGKEFNYLGSAMPPGPNRVHYIQDAESAWKNGNPLLAVSYYEIAAQNSVLDSYWTSYEIINKQTALAKPYQRAFAFFCIIAIWLYLDRPEVASEYIQDMKDAFPHGKHGNTFVLAAQEMFSSYEKNVLFSPACAKAVNLLDAQFPDIVKNHLGDWGVANPMYFTTSDICKFE